MKHILLQDENILTRVRWLMLSRVSIATFLLGITLFIHIRKTEMLPEASFVYLYVLILVAYFLSIIYVLLLRFIHNLKVNVYIQAIFDVAFITGLVFVTGGIRSIYSIFYPLVIIYSALFLERRGGLVIASACGILYGLLLDLEFYQIITPLYDKDIEENAFSAGYIFTRIIIHILSFYIISFLASFVVEKEKITRALLEEKETAFDQLDLLHRSIIESVDTGILTINLQGKIKSFNRAAEEITGFSFYEIENKNIVEIFPEYFDISDDILKQDHTKSAKRRFDMFMTTKDKKRLILGCSVSDLRDTKTRRIGDIIIFQDLTSMREMENALDKSKRLAFIGEMAAGLAHEIRNPLASISGSVQMLKNDLQLDAADGKLMQIIMRGKDQLENVIKDFLLLARPNKGNHEPVHINDVITEVIESVHYIPDWHDQISINLVLNENLIVYANRTEIREVLWNLILNAIQVMPEQGILTIKTKIAGSTLNGKWMEMVFTDTGFGIEHKHLDKIFEPFYTTKERGTGLGLAIVNRIVESYSGHISIESIPLKGTTFVVHLPLMTS